MPVAIEIGADLLVVCALLVLIGLSKALQYTLVAFLHWIGHAIRATHIPGSGYVANHIDDGARWLYNQIGVGILALEHTTVWLFHNLAALATLLGEQIKGLAYDLLWVYHRVEKFTVPYWINRLEHWVIRQLVAFARHPVRYLRSAEADIRRGVGALERAVPQAAARVTHLEHTVAHAVPAAVAEAPPWIGRRLGELEREISEQEHGRFSFLERLALAALGAGVALRLLERVAPWVRCRNVHSLGRAACRLPVKALEQLLAGAIDVLLIRDLCAIVSGLIGAARLASPVIEEITAMTSDLIACQHAERPPALALPPLDAPPVLSVYRLALG